MRGNQRTSGDLSRREGGKIFGSGSRTPIAITLLVRNPTVAHGKAKIFYHDIGDYLSREDKLAKIKEFGNILNPAMELSSITPNEAGDWLNQRDGIFETFIPIEADKKFNTKTSSAFVLNSRGLETARDSWVYNSSMDRLSENIQNTIAFYNAQVTSFQNETDKELAETKLSFDTTKISWSSSLLSNLHNGNMASFSPNSFATAMYRPFFKQNLYRGELLIHRRGQWDMLFPTPQTKNLVICVSGIGGKTFSTLMTNCIPDLHILESGTQCFPLYYYETVDQGQPSLFDRHEDDFIRRNGISDFILEHARKLYGSKITREDIFHYIYGLLHSSDYRNRFEADLTKMLPHIPLPEDTKLFRAFLSAGRELAALHVDYETAEKWPDAIVSVPGAGFIIEKIRFDKTGGKDDKRTIILAPGVKIENVPLLAYEYVVNGKSAIEWIMERYQYTSHSDSKIVNDPNAWGIEHGQSRYVLDLLLRIITVSMKTLQLTAKLPMLEFPDT